MGEEMGAETTPDTISLSVPARVEYVPIVRLLVAGVANRIQLTLDEIEDLRLAVDELCHSLVDADHPAGEMVITCRVLSEALAIEGVSEVPVEESERRPTEIQDLSRRILDALTDEYEVDLDGDQRRFRMLKKRAVV